jgi:ssDNA-binding Zn-finger/Zn-ribbon topoisomerase 1
MMPTVMVKCPICGKVKVLRQAGRFYFKCCGIAHNLQENIICVGVSLKKATRENPEKIDLELENFLRKGLGLEVKDGEEKG